MNRLFQMLLLAIAMTITMPVMAQTSKEQAKAEKKAAKEKKKKEKKPYVWNWDGTLSGNATFDDYLKTVTEIWNEMESYEKEFGCYTYVQDTIYNEQDGKLYIMAYMQDSLGNLITRNQSNWQIANSVMAGVNIVLSATNASLATANATLALPELGLNAIVFAPYIKGGPMVIAKGMNEMGAIAKVNKITARQWKAAKNGALDPATLGLFSEQEVKLMNKCCYLKEIVDTDPMKAEWITRHQQKSPEELAAEAASRADFANKEVLPEDANKSLDDEEFDESDFEDSEA